MPESSASHQADDDPLTPEPLPTQNGESSCFISNPKSHVNIPLYAYYVSICINAY